MSNINPFTQTLSAGVCVAFYNAKQRNELWFAVVKEYQLLPKVPTEIASENYRFWMTYMGVRLLVIESKVGGLSVMLPEEY